MTTTVSLKQGETRTSSGPIPHHLIQSVWFHVRSDVGTYSIQIVFKLTCKLNSTECLVCIRMQKRCTFWTALCFCQIEIVQTVHMWCNQTKWVWSQSNSIFILLIDWLIDCTHHLQSYILQHIPLKLLNWFQRYGHLKGCKNNRKQTNCVLYFAMYLKISIEGLHNARYAPKHARFCPAAWFPFCMAWYREKQQQKNDWTFDLLHRMIQTFHWVCVLIFLSHCYNLVLKYELNKK